MNNRSRRYRSRCNYSSEDPRRYYYRSTDSRMNDNSRRNCNWNNYRSEDRSKHHYSKRTQHSSDICRINHSFFRRSSTIWKINVCRYTHWILAWIRFRNSKIQDRVHNIILRLELNNLYNYWRTRDWSIWSKDNTCNFWNAYSKRWIMKYNKN